MLERRLIAQNTSGTEPDTLGVGRKRQAKVPVGELEKKTINVESEVRKVMKELLDRIEGL